MGPNKMAKKVYEVDQIDRMLRDHNSEEPIKFKFWGSKFESNTLNVPLPLLRIIKEWYFLHGDKL
jgi:hypothetical protein